jgi:anti-sigma B factor antagonist
MDKLDIREVEGAGGVAVVHLSGALTLGSLFEFQDATRREWKSGLVLALGGVAYMDSAGLGAILGLFAASQRKGTGFALAEVGKRVMTLLEVSKVDGLVPRYGSVDEAAAALTAGQPGRN